MACVNQNGVQQAAYHIEMRVNGVLRDVFKLRRVHSTTEFDSLTLSGHTIVELAAGDLITFHLVPENTSPRLYYIGAGQARLTVKKEPWY